MAITQIGDTSLVFGLASEEGGLQATSSVQATRKREKKEAKNREGEVVSVVFLNPTTEITVEGLGDFSGDIGDAFTLNSFSFNGTAHIEEITRTRTNEEFLKTSIKAMAYDNIT